MEDICLPRFVLWMSRLGRRRRIRMAQTHVLAKLRLPKFGRHLFAQICFVVSRPQINALTLGNRSLDHNTAVAMCTH